MLWNATLIAALVLSGASADLPFIATTVAWGSVVGSLLQFAVQLPAVRSVERGLARGDATSAVHVRTVVSNFGPAVATRGVVQLSAYVDTILASLIGAGALATLSYAQAISLLPISLFGMSVAASELPAMSAAGGTGEALAKALRARLASGLQRIAYFIIPSAVGFVLLGGVIAAGLYEGGAFVRADALFVWGALAGSAVGLLAGTSGRLYASASFALRDTRTPFQFALLRVGLAAVAGGLFGLGVPHWLEVDPRWGIGALTAASGAAAWIEFSLLRRHIESKVGVVVLPEWLAPRLWGSAFLAGVVGVLATRVMMGRHPVLTAVVVLGLYAGSYLGLTRIIGADRARRA